jgi:hypothetical protein
MVKDVFNLIHINMGAFSAVGYFQGTLSGLRDGNNTSKS